MDTIQTIQAHLSRLGQRLGRIDGDLGPRTRAALSAVGIAADLSPEKAARQLTRQVTREQVHLPLPTLSQLQTIAPRFPAAWVEPLHDAIRLAHITQPRLPMFLAQLAHESDGFATLEEYASGEAYEGRRDLGNTQPGDGVRFKGRGPIQITGRANYARYGGLLGVDLVAHPERAATPRIGFCVAAMYWLDSGLNALADADDFTAITRRINGGTNGLQDRERWLQRARALFDDGAGLPETPAPQTPPPIALIPPRPPPFPPSVSEENMTAQAQERDQEQPLRDWLAEFFHSDHRRERRAGLRATFVEMQHFLMGVHETLYDEIIDEEGDVEEALEHILEGYLDIVIDRLAEDADQRLDWERVSNTDIRVWLEKHDGAFIRRLFSVARSMAALKRQRRVGSRLLTMLPGPAHAPGIVQHSEGVVEANATEAASDPAKQNSGRSLTRRLQAIQRDDHRATSRTPADLPGRQQ